MRTASEMGDQDTFDRPGLAFRDTIHGSDRDATIYGTLVGSGGKDYIHGGDGDDIIFGRGGDDVLHGEADDDILDGGDGADTLAGGAGWDTASYLNSPCAVSINLASEQGFGGEAEGDVLSGIEEVWGSAWDDFLLGDDLANSLDGDDGNDTLNGGGDIDYLYGGIGADTLKGGGGHDTLDGEQGDDTLDGGNGFDILTGGQGADTFVLRSTQDSYDEVTDFNPAEGDLLDFSSIDANVLMSGDQSFTFIGYAGSFHCPGPDHVRRLRR